MNDDDLRALMRQADPSAGDPRLDDARIRRIVAAAERDDLAGNTATAPRHRRRLFAGVSLGAAATAGAAALIAGLVATPAIQAPGPGPDETPAACQAPTVASLQEFDTAYEATATAVSGENVTLTVTEVFAGTPGTTLTVEQVQEDTGVLFTAGQTYLVAATDDFISPCDSGPATDALRQLYTTAFGTSSNG